MLHLASCIAAVSLFVSSTAHAQATRTWVSGVGDDANPGSRTAPCKTFAGAISKTAAGGEINCIDAGGFGALTITKSITIDGAGVLSSIMATGTNGVIINAGASDTVVLRNLSIKNPGGGVTPPSGLHGVKVLQAGAVVIENCTISSGTDTAVAFEPSNAGAKLTVKNCTFVGCAGGGIKITPSGAGSAAATVSDTMVQLCKYGLRADPNSKVAATQSVFSQSTLNGAVAIGNADITLSNCTLSQNSNNGVNSGSGGAGSTVRLSGCQIVGNAGNGITNGAGSQVISLGNNFISGNGTDGAPTSTIAPK